MVYIPYKTGRIELGQQPLSNNQTKLDSQLLSSGSDEGKKGKVVPVLNYISTTGGGGVNVWTHIFLTSTLAGGD
jgi:hypothetical protein